MAPAHRRPDPALRPQHPRLLRRLRPALPKTQGAFLRDSLGGDYVSIGFSIHSGAFKAFGTDDNVIRTYRVGAAQPRSNTHTLDRARPRDYILDMRTAPAPCAPGWPYPAPPGT
ncbi:erythromycin esterase family protein [Streptomyces fungicidicus]